VIGRGSGLFYAHNTGGAEVLAPIILGLSERYGRSLDVIAHSPASRVLERLGIDHMRLSDLEEPPLDEARARGLLSLRNNAWAVQGVTNLGDRTNANLTLACKEVGIPTIGFMDNWLHWDSLEETRGDFRYAPDVVGVMDDCARQQLESRGLPSDRIEVVGHPHLERTARLPGPSVSGSPSQRGTVTWLVVSQRVHRESSLDERATLLDVPVEGELLSTLLSRAATSLREGNGQETLIILRPHPIEKKIDEERQEAHGVTVRVDATTPIEQLVARSSVVIGLYGMPMIHAFYTGKRTISLANIFGIKNTCIDRYGFFEQVSSVGELMVALGGDARPRGQDGKKFRDALVTGSLDRCMTLLSRIISSTAV
jgi:hypothetical protein